VARRQNPEIDSFILGNVEEHPVDVVSLTAGKFGLSRSSINRYVRRLIDDGLLVAEGKTKARHYKLRNIVNETFKIEGITKNLSEDTVWRYRVLPFLNDVPQNIIDICQYGFTEMFNNVIDHSVSESAVVSIERTAATTDISVRDFGVGVFQKIQNDFNLPDPQSALLELSKGKLTSDKANHAGEGIFLTSRMFDEFSLLSGGLSYIKTRTDDFEWLIETGYTESEFIGTNVRMAISNSAPWTTKRVFAEFLGDAIGYRKTQVSIKLGKYPGEQLVSRSQAKRILARFDEFSEVTLDFEGIDTIGQAFADEVFRVFGNNHPDIELFALNANEDVQMMIDHVRSQQTKA